MVETAWNVNKASELGANLMEKLRLCASKLSGWSMSRFGISADKLRRKTEKLSGYTSCVVSQV